ncbi:hypothetical protein D3OALGA1CA_4966 [Olavius algarvensis associated proteobacterium Delta 3]|nr:hypothetical protein D3OALGA1CA_4966 [Olavius algarvensis associated proteobacterium Delta 3]
MVYLIFSTCMGASSGHRTNIGAKARNNHPGGTNTASL